MGYETTYIVVNETSLSDGFHLYYASFDMCKIGPKKACFGKKFEGLFFFPGDGNKIIREDYYGKPLCEASLSDTIKEFENMRDTAPNYSRRILLVLEYLRALEPFDTEFCKYKVLHYGY